MRVLISGDIGFVGRHFVEFLLSEGHEVVGFDIKPYHPANASYLHLRSVDAREFFASNKDHFDVAIHLAAIIGGRATIDGEPLTVATDLGIDAAFFNWAYRTKPRHVIYYSSSAAYGVELQRDPGYRLKETDLVVDGAHRMLVPDMTYGWSKLTGEYLAHHLRQAGVSVHVFRPFSGYGSDQGHEYPFGAFIDRALQHEDPFEIWGTGQQTRDWVHIDDVVRGTWQITLDAPQDAYNVCTGIPTPFEELARKVTMGAGYDPTQFNYLVQKPSGVHYRVGDPTKFLQYYTPQITLDEGIARAIKERVTA